MEVISIDPVVTSTHEYLGREHVKHIAVNPQTDVPLQLALAAQKAGISVGQYKAAMRTLPAQFTDIVTQLAGGQNPFL
ncbi:phage tail length tape measure family protein, partial [Escherichia coli]|uniref:phage tail length tape measure family protein n=1 Tax=Escherichia coli TaxID=562 RepID=UPI003F4D18E3